MRAFLSSAKNFDSVDLIVRETLIDERRVAYGNIRQQSLDNAGRIRDCRAADFEQKTRATEKNDSHVVKHEPSREYRQVKTVLESADLSYLILVES